MKTRQPPARGWLHRVLSAASLLLVVGAIVVLYRMLHDLDWVAVGAALRDMSWMRIGCAALLITGAYVTLTFYDHFALRSQGFRLPYLTAALAGFSSYAIGHNIGATTVAAAAIRYRVYADRGLDALAVAKVCVVAGITFWLGNAAVLGASLALYPATASAIDHLPEHVNRAAGIATLVGLALYVTWVGPHGRRVGVRDVHVRLPGRRSTLLQIAIGVADLSLCVLAMYVLVPDVAMPIGEFAVVFVSATLLSFASQAPGGIGVFDAAMLLGLPDVPKATLVASIIVYRVLYYLVPFAVALALLLGREVTVAGGRVGRA
jgi:hypothetical protein